MAISSKHIEMRGSSTESRVNPEDRGQGKQEERHVLAYKEDVDGAKIEFVEIGQGCYTVSARIHACIKL